MTPTILCKVLFASSLFFSQSWLNANPEIERQAAPICVEIAEKAIAQDVNPAVAVALAYSESRFKENAKSKVGAVGPMQVIPKWTCPNRRRRGCDLVQAGVDTLKDHLLTYGCDKDLSRFSKRLKRTKGIEVFRDWAKTVPACTEPDWETVICHYNSGLNCRNRTFPRLVIKRAIYLVDLLEEEGYELAW